MNYGPNKNTKKNFELSSFTKCGAHLSLGGSSGFQLFGKKFQPKKNPDLFDERKIGPSVMAYHGLGVEASLVRSRPSG